MPKPGPKYTKWLVPARWARPRQRTPDESQNSRFYKDEEGMHDNLYGATKLNVSEPFWEVNGELLVRTTWVDNEGVQTYDELPLEHLQDYEPELKKFDQYLESHGYRLYAWWRDKRDLWKKHRKQKLRTVQGDEVTDNSVTDGEDDDDSDDSDDQPPHKGNRIRKITDDDDDDSDNPPLAQPPPLSNEWVRIGPSKITGAVAGQDDGLLAVRDIPRNTKITDYKIGATKLNEEEFRARYPTGKATHVWNPSKGVYYDASNPTTLASAAMRGGANNPNNARITGSGAVVTTKDVRAGQEIFLPYGGTFRIAKDVAPPAPTTILEAARVARQANDDVVDWTLPNDKRHNPNRYGWDPDKGYLYHTPPTAQQTPTILQAAANARQLRTREQKRTEEEWPMQRWGKPKPTNDGRPLITSLPPTWIGGGTQSSQESIPEIFDRNAIVRIIDKRDTAEGVKYFVRTMDRKVSWIQEELLRQRPDFERALRKYKEIFESPVRASSPADTELVTTDDDEPEEYYKALDNVRSLLGLKRR